MAKYFSPSNDAFYDTDVINTALMPSDVIAVSDSDYQALMNEQCNGKVIIAGTDGKPVAVNQNCTPCECLVHDLKVATTEEIGHVKVDGQTIAVDDAGTIKIVHENDVPFTAYYDPFIVASGRNELTIKAPLKIGFLNEGIVEYLYIDNDIILSNVGFGSGVDFSIHAYQNGNIEVKSSDIAPVNNARIIGGFHTLCWDAYELREFVCNLGIAQRYPAGDYITDSAVTTMYAWRIGESKTVYTQSKKPYMNEIVYSNTAATKPISNVTAVNEHPLDGFIHGNILPQSVWCLNHRPYSNPAGMVYIPETDMWVDIYLSSGDFSNPESKYNQNPQTNCSYYTYSEAIGMKKKRVIDHITFMFAMEGSNQLTNGLEGQLTGGNADSNGRRMVSKYGCEDGCGMYHQWIGDINNGPIGETWGQGAVPVNGVKGSKGLTRGEMHVLVGGGYYGINASYCGSMCRDEQFFGSTERAFIVGRGMSKNIRN